MRNAGLDELQDGIKLARRDSNNFRYHSNGRKGKELKNLSMRVKESEKAGLKLNIRGIHVNPWLIQVNV